MFIYRCQSLKVGDILEAEVIFLGYQKISRTDPPDAYVLSALSLGDDGFAK